MTGISVDTIIHGPDSLHSKQPDESCSVARALSSSSSNIVSVHEKAAVHASFLPHDDLKLFGLSLRKDPEQCDLLRVLHEL